MILLGLALAIPVLAAPATAPPMTAGVEALSSPMVVAPFKPVVTPKPAAMTAPKPAAENKAADKPKVDKPTPEWKTAAFWIAKVGLPVILFILGFGWLKKSWLLYLKEKGILVVADKVANGFESFAKGTPAKWDDALALALKAVIARFGELTIEQETKVMAVINDRRGQAEKKNRDG